MKIGLLVPSIYMHGENFRKRISAPMELVVSLADGLTKQGVEVTLFSGPDVPINAKVVTADEELINADYKIDYQQDMPKSAYEAVSFYEKKKYFEMGVVSKAYKMAMDKEVDLIHVYHSYGNLSHYFAEMLPVPTLFTLHVLPPPENTFERWRYKRFANQDYAAISKRQVEGFKEFAPNINIADIIYHGINHNDYKFNHTPQDYIAFIGRLIPQKGLHNAIKIANNSQKKLRVATHINDVIMESEYFKNEIAPHLDSEYVELNDLFGLEKKVDLYQNAKVFLSPIQWEEPFGMVMIESMSCGTPVVAFARGSVPEVIKDGETGFIVNFSEDDKRGDWIVKKSGVEGLQEAIDKIYSMPKEEYEQMRFNCRKSVEENYTVEKMAENHISLYKRLLGQ